MLVLVLGSCLEATSESIPPGMGNPLAMPVVGSSELKILTPTLLELMLITTKEPAPAPVTEWNFVGENFALHLPGLTELRVLANGKEVPIVRLGFKRRALYAPLKGRDLRL